MKKLPALIFFLSISFCFVTSVHAQFDKLKQKIKDKVNERVDDKTDKAIDKTLDDAENSAKNNGDKKSTDKNTTSKDKDKTVIAGPPNIKAYQNYDFVPGDKVLFDDYFIDDQDGEFPAHWELLSGQAITNKVNGAEKALFLTEGNYARVQPRMKTDAYLTDPFTIEYDTYFVPGTYGPMVMFSHDDKTAGYKREGSVHVNRDEVSFASDDINFSKSLPDDINGENFENKWHHIAIAYKNRQLKVYVDQYRILVVPDTKQSYESIEFAGIGDEKTPIIVKNVRIASGGQMNMIGKKFTESKIITHGINFDIDKATIKPESMGTLNMIVQVMKDNPDLKFEVDGHTDNSGTPAHNLALSQQRADAVKDQLVKMGIEASRLSTKGLGDTQPVNDNSTSDGKANNRRVEFVKM